MHKVLHCLRDTPSLCVFYDAANQWLYCQWLGQHDTASIRQSAETIFACLATQPCCKMLSDHSQLVGDWQAAAQGVVRRNFERLAAYGIVHVAWVCSLNCSDQAAMEQVLELTARPSVALFSDVASAYEWLGRCPRRVVW